MHTVQHAGTKNSTSIASCKTYNLLLSLVPEILPVHGMRVEPDLLDVILVLLLHPAATAACDQNNYDTRNNDNDHTQYSSNGTNYCTHSALSTGRWGTGRWGGGRWGGGRGW